MFNYRRVLYEIWKVLPSNIKSYVKNKRKKNRIIDIVESTKEFTLGDFSKALESFQLRENQVVFVHSGADWFRNIEGGTLQVLKMLLDETEFTTIAMPSFPFDGMMSDYVDSQQFDITKAPSKMGLLTELFRRTPGVERSLHPSHSVCAKGELAEYLVKDHQECVRPFESISPFGKIVQLKGKILLIGVGLEVLTHVHTCEDKLREVFPENVYEPEIRQGTMINKEQEETPYRTYVHDKNVSITKNINKFETELISHNIMEKKSVSGVDITLIDAASLERFLINKAESGSSIYG